MLSILRDIPDWGVGVLAASGTWYGVCHSVLADRVLQSDVDARVTPSCMATLRAQEADAIDAKIAHLKRNAEYELGRERDRLRTEDRRLLSLQGEAQAVEMTTQMINQSSLGMLFQIPDLGISADVVQERRDRLQDQMDRLKIPEFTIPPVPDAEVLKTCACATADAIGGKRTAYAISLATFRIWEPDEIKRLGSDVTKVLSGGQCGPKPWEAHT
ncbi:MAG: hypothetical protein AAGH41_02675 [Pseudomonadota bacterium]